MPDNPETTIRDLGRLPYAEQLRCLARRVGGVYQPDTAMLLEAADALEQLKAENKALIHDNARLVEGWTAECNREGPSNG